MEEKTTECFLSYMAYKTHCERLRFDYVSFGEWLEQWIDDTQSWDECSEPSEANIADTAGAKQSLRFAQGYHYNGVNYAEPPEGFALSIAASPASSIADAAGASAETLVFYGGQVKEPCVAFDDAAGASEAVGEVHEHQDGTFRIGVRYYGDAPPVGTKLYTHPSAAGASEGQAELAKKLTKAYEDGYNSRAPYSAPFNTDVSHCCGDPDTCNDPCEVEDPYADRYRVEKGLIMSVVKCGDGTRDLFSGPRLACLKVAAELTTAFRDGQYAAGATVGKLTEAERSSVERLIDAIPAPGARRTVSGQKMTKDQLLVLIREHKDHVGTVDEFELADSVIAALATFQASSIKAERPQHVHRFGGQNIRYCMECGFDSETLPHPPYTDKGRAQ